VLFVIGRKDTLITESMAKESAAEFPNSEVRVIEGVGHSLMVEAPEEFVSFVKEL